MKERTKDDGKIVTENFECLLFYLVPCKGAREHG